MLALADARATSTCISTKVGRLLVPDEARAAPDTEGFAAAARPARGPGLQRRRRPPLARGQPERHRAGPHRRGATCTIPTTTASRRSTRPCPALADCATGRHRRVRRRHEPGPMLTRFVARDRRRRGDARRPVHPARPVGAPRAAAHLLERGWACLPRGSSTAACSPPRRPERRTTTPGAPATIVERAARIGRVCARYDLPIAAAAMALPRRAIPRCAASWSERARPRRWPRRCRAVRTARPRGPLGPARRRGADSTHVTMVEQMLVDSHVHFWDPQEAPARVARRAALPAAGAFGPGLRRGRTRRRADLRPGRLPRRRDLGRVSLGQRARAGPPDPGLVAYAPLHHGARRAPSSSGWPRTRAWSACAGCCRASPIAADQRAPGGRRRPARRARSHLRRLRHACAAARGDAPGRALPGRDDRARPPRQAGRGGRPAGPVACRPRCARRAAERRVQALRPHDRGRPPHMDAGGPAALPRACARVLRPGALPGRQRLARGDARDELSSGGSTCCSSSWPTCRRPSARRSCRRRRLGLPPTTDWRAMSTRQARFTLRSVHVPRMCSCIAAAAPSASRLSSCS